MTSTICTQTQWEGELLALCISCSLATTTKMSEIPQGHWRFKESNSCAVGV